MASITLYCDKNFGENPKKFNSAQLDLGITPDLFQNAGGQSQFPFDLGAEKYTNPKTGSEGMAFRLTVRTNGMAYLNLDGADELCKAPVMTISYENGLVKGNYDPEYKKVEKSDDLYNIFYRTLYDEYTATDGFRKAVCANRQSKPENPIAFPNGYGSRHFYTMAGMYFALKHVNTFYPGSGYGPGWGTVYTFANMFSCVNLTGSSADRYNYMRLGVDGQKLAKRTSPETNEGFNNIMTYDQYIIDGQVIKSKFKQFLVTGTLPAGVPIWDYDNRQYFPSEESYDFIGIMNVEYTIDGIPQNAYIGGFTADAWVGDEREGFWGENSGVEGGEGAFESTTDDVFGSEILDEIFDRNPGGHGDRFNEKGILGGVWIGQNGLRLYTNFDFNGLISCLYTEDWIERFKQSKYNPMSGIISAFIMPWGVRANGTGTSMLPLSSLSQRINMTLSGYEVPEYTKGNLHFSPTANCVMDSNVRVYLGSLHIPRYYDSYLDYQTKIDLYLPFCGWVNIPTHMCMGNSIMVYYSIDYLNGACTAYVQCWTEVEGKTYTYPAITATGNCAYQIPVTGMEGGNYLAVMLNSLQSGIGVISDIKGGIAKAFTGDIAGAGAALDPMNMTKGALKTGIDLANVSSHSQVTGNFSGSAIMTNSWRVMCQITRPVQNLPAKYYELEGHPCDISGTINNVDGSVGEQFKGFLRCKDIKLDGIDATDEEKNMINNLLMSGIYIK